MNKMTTLAILIALLSAGAAVGFAKDVFPTRE
jgi:hypothetical protein